MKILKLLNKTYLSILIIVFFSTVNSFSENEPVDIWNIDKEQLQENSENKELISITENELEGEKIDEVILALSATVDGQTTAHYVADTLSKHSVEVSRLGHGVPVGGELDYMDEGTIAAALSARQKI